VLHTPIGKRPPCWRPLCLVTGPNSGCMPPFGIDRGRLGVSLALL
jgi:hypothetical protein